MSEKRPFGAVERGPAGRCLLVERSVSGEVGRQAGQQGDGLAEPSPFAGVEGLANGGAQGARAASALPLEAGAAGVGEVQQELAAVVGVLFAADQAIGGEVFDRLGGRLVCDAAQPGEICCGQGPAAVEESEDGGLVREVAPHDAYAVHDGALNDIGTAMVEGFLGERGPGVPARHHRLAPGTSVRIG
jgi:hypothetical protein